MRIKTRSVNRKKADLNSGGKEHIYKIARNGVKLLCRAERTALKNCMAEGSIMKREDVKKILPEITGDQLDEIMKLHGESVTEYKAGLSSLREKFAKADERLSEYEGMDIDKKMAEEYKRGKSDAEKELEAHKLSAEIDSALARAGARNTKALRALLNTDDIKLENGILTGIDTQLEKIKEENGFLFESSDSKPKFTAGVTGGAEISKDAFSRMGYGDRVKLYNENPEMYRELNG